MQWKRREFLTAAAVAGATALAPRRASAGSTPADVRIGVIGLRNRGFEHMHAFAANLEAVCDVDSAVLEERSRQFEKEFGRRLATYGDFRELLARRDVDAVTIATPNHTHAYLAVEALRAGKHVYVEKPVSHNIWEGRRLVAAVEQAAARGLVVQCGTQGRSWPSLHKALAWIRGGELGKPLYALGACYKPRPSIGKLNAPLAIPATVNYDLWCGPAEQEELYRPQFHYDWHWNFNTGAGDVGNQGIHQMDLARWLLGETTLAPRTLSIGGRVGYEDAGETPNSQVVYHAYPAAPLLFEVRGLPRSLAAQSRWGASMDQFRELQVGVIVQYEGGHVYAAGDYSHVSVYDRRGVELQRWSEPVGLLHFQNWLDAVAAGDPRRVNGPVREGHVSTSLCHVGNVSHRLGEPLPASEIARAVVGDDLLSGSFERLASHLRANGVDVDSPPGALKLGPWLEIDVAEETFRNNPAADRLRARKYRPGFELPGDAAPT
jgi:predicted dehydrogenase